VALTLIITDAGRAALVDQASGGTRAVRIAAVGVSAAAVTASAASTTLPGEVKRITAVAGEASATDVVHLTVQDETAATYTVRSFALYLDTGVLFALYGQADPIVQKSTQSVLLLAIDIKLADVPAGAITFGDTGFINPPATTARPGVVELATDAEAEAGTDATRALTPASIGAALSAGRILSRLLTVDGAGCGLDADLLDGREGGDHMGIGMGTERWWTSSDLELRFRFGQGSTTYLSGAGSVPVEIRNAAGAQLATFGAAGGLNVSGPIYAQGGLVWHAANDGAGSGLDADLLDGRHAGDFALLSGAGFVGRVTAAGGFYRDDNFYMTLPLDGLADLSFDQGDVIRYTRGADQYDFYIAGAVKMSIRPTIAHVATAFNVAGAITQGGSQVWHVANDGAGSGLDADLLDGRHAGDFALLSGAGFAGRVTAAGGFYRDDNFSMTFPLDGLADLSFDQGDLIRYTRGADQYDFYIAGAVKMSLRPTIAHVATSFNVAGAITQGGSQVWHVANDGAGSGLDADLLDGQQGSWYTDVVARLGYTPLDAAGYTATDILAKALTVDGAGSGLDADLLDGQQGSWYADVAARLGYTPLQAGDFTAAAILAKLLTVDGAGSGLDADLLDGLQAADFLRTTGSSFDVPGWRQQSDGFIEQWGEIPGPITARGNRAVAFPIAFPNRCLGIEAVAINPNSTTSGGTTTIQRVSLSPTGATLRAQNEDSAITDCAGGISWRAWGY